MIKTFARTAAVVLTLCPLATTGGYAQDGARPDSSSSTATQVPLRRVDGSVSVPQVIHHVPPEFSEEARKEKFGGVVVVGLIVDTNGLPQQVHVLRGVGHGLDEKAVEAVRHYRFHPAMENGKPVPVQVNVEVNFQIRDKE